ncbi:MAG: mitochondrial fission ELM1 family protein [Deltaproteobacteria bacterium]|nr:mitochondrial fission ELM1 family protein [Deltaproteobacteria bacterium]
MERSEGRGGAREHALSRGEAVAPHAPRVWLVVGEKPGDNAQIDNVARALGWAFVEKRVRTQPRWAIAKPRVRPSLGHIDRERSDPLEPPWPDLIITAGRRLSSVALWIKRQSGGRTRVVVVGKPRGMLDAFDLILAAAHYVLPGAPNVLRYALPLMQVDPRKLEAAAVRWRERLADQPRPLVALFVGGPTGGLRFDPAMARDLVAKASESARAEGGSLAIATSRRTPPGIVEALRRVCPEDAQLFEFDAEAGPSGSAYYGLLSLADRFVATTDSISMMVEVVRLGRPLALYPLDRAKGRCERLLEAIGILRPRSPQQDPIPGGGLRTQLMDRLGWPIHSRDLTAMPRLLVEQSLASWVGEPPVRPHRFEDDALERITEKIREIVEADASGSPSD